MASCVLDLRSPEEKKQAADEFNNFIKACNSLVKGEKWFIFRRSYDEFLILGFYDTTEEAEAKANKINKVSCCYQVGVGKVGEWR